MSLPLNEHAAATKIINYFECLRGESQSSSEARRAASCRNFRVQEPHLPDPKMPLYGSRVSGPVWQCMQTAPTVETPESLTTHLPLAFDHTAARTINEESFEAKRLAVSPKHMTNCGGVNSFDDIANVVDSKKKKLTRVRSVISTKNDTGSSPYRIVARVFARWKTKCCISSSARIRASVSRVRKHQNEIRVSESK